MNKNTMILVGIGAAALLFLFRKQIFGGGNDENGGGEDTTPDTTGPSENVEVPTETGGDTAFKPFAPPVPTHRPDFTKVNTTTAIPNSNPLFFTAPNPTALGGR
jgi:hypothetical protein